MGNKIICEIIISPVGVGRSVSKYVKAAIDVIESEEGIRSMTHPMGTVFESDNLEKVFEVTRKAHESVFKLGGQRVVTQLRIDDRRDKQRIMEDKVNAIKD